MKLIILRAIQIFTIYFFICYIIIPIIFDKINMKKKFKYLIVYTCDFGFGHYSGFGSPSCLGNCDCYINKKSLDSEAIEEIKEKLSDDLKVKKADIIILNIIKL